MRELLEWNRKPLNSTRVRRRRDSGSTPSAHGKRFGCSACYSDASNPELPILYAAKAPTSAQITNIGVSKYGNTSVNDPISDP